MLLLITLRMLVLHKKEALREQQRESKTSATIQQIEKLLTTAVSRIVAYGSQLRLEPVSQKKVWL